MGGGWEIVFVLWGMNDFLGLVGGELGGGCREGGWMIFVWVGLGGVGGDGDDEFVVWIVFGC